MKSALFAVFVIFFISLSTTNAHAFYCGTETVGRWDSANDVIRKCGQPLKKFHDFEMIDGRKRYCEIWLYNCGDNDFIYKLIIINNKIFREGPFQRGQGRSQCNANH